ncbi:MAG: asparaginyl/glutamyl-tRNA amidotransferase subunit C [Omnitrophica WOR_2 bacterium RBG_13_44_8b]|nr:MAG: asparaginyl/glutamyl-tRNA amidotransferase subunit C [Omnitrophica WOR_2 bacterium RBG_13_44_8b]
MAINKQTVEYVAHLARIELQPKELDKLSRQLQDILDFIDKLNKLNVEKIQPTSHILPINNVFRQDIPSESLLTDKTLSCAPGNKGSFFVVPKVIE